MRALIVQDDHSVAVEQIDKPEASGNNILVKVTAVGLNPGDLCVAFVTPESSLTRCSKVQLRIFWSA